MYGRRPVVGSQRMMGNGMAYDGASTDAYSQRWATYETSPDSELSQSLPALRSRSADLVRNNALAYGIIDTLQQGVIGRGPRWKSRSQYAGIIEELFRSWTKTAAWDGVSSWMDVGYDLISASCISGDVLVIWPDVGDGSEPRIDLIDARRIDTPSDRTPECSTCRLGVGYDKYGRVLGYYVKASDDAGTLRENFRWFPLMRGGRVNARLFRRPSVRRPRQSRGVGILAPILHQLKEVPAYLLTENRRATQAAKNFVIVSTPDPKAISDAFENIESSANEADIKDLMGRSFGNIPDGSMMVLGLGESAQIAQPPMVNGGIGDYVEAQLRACATAVGLPFEEAFRLYAKLNFSNARTIRLMAKAAYRNWRDKVEGGLCDPTIRLLVQYWWARGAFGRIPWSEELISGSWAWDEMEWVDPQKETKANSEAISTNQKSLQQVAASQGADWRQIIADNVEAEAYESELRKAAGLPPKVNPNAPPPENPDPEAVDPLEPPEDEDV